MSATVSGTERTGAPLDELSRVLSGRLLRPDEADFDRVATPWNVAVAWTASPIAVVEALDPADVVAAVRFARRHGLTVSVQATGHGACNELDGTLMVHTGRLTGCVVHAEGWARVEAGVRWETVLEAAAPHGLAALAGSAPDVGVVGYITGGGVGPVARTFGVASDRVRAFDVVTGDGELRRVSPTQHPDLFWGLRGGKGALGIVTAVEFDLVPLAEIYGGALFFDGDDAAAVVEAWRQWCVTLPANGTTSLALMQLPLMPGVPEPLAGRLTVAVRFAWVGDAAAGEQAVAGIRGAATPVFGGLTVMPYAALGTIHSDPVEPMPVHDSALLLDDLTAEAAQRLVELAGPGSGSPQVVVELRHLGGAIARESGEPSAVCHRDGAFSLMSIGLAVPEVVDHTRSHASRLMRGMADWWSSPLGWCTRLVPRLGVLVRR